MTKFEKIGTMFLAFIGASSGLWGAFTVHDSAQFKQPLDKHTVMAKSFTDQIHSVSKRNDKPETIRLRKEYEKFEENWRKEQMVVAVIESSLSLPPNEVPESQKQLVSSWLSEINIGLSLGLNDANMMADALFIAGDYQKAVDAYKTGLLQNPSSGENLIGQARSYGYLSLAETNPELQKLWHKEAVNSVMTVISLPSKDSITLTNGADLELNNIFYEAQQKLIRQ
jgi:tetratricopeptide (TPR) repeat protein